MKKRYIIGLIVCCLMIVPMVGCTTKKATTNTSVQTPLQVLTGRVNASDSVNSRQDQNITDLSNRITTEIAAVPRVDIAPLIARVGVLESLNMSTFAGDLSFLTVRVSSLESYNLSTRIIALENISHDITSIIGSYNISQLMTIYHNLLNISTNSSTPTPTPTVNCSLVKKPAVIYPTNGNMSMPNTSIIFQWQDSNANGYEFWFGTDPASLTQIAILDKDVLAYPFPAPNSDTYYFWRVIALSPCGNLSTMWWFKTQ